MFYYLCLALICGLTAAKVTNCPDGETSCGEGEACCFSNGRFNCCDLVDDPRIVAGSPSLPYLNSTLSGAPSSGVTYDAPDTIWDYCPRSLGKKICCDPTRVTCLSGSDCCSNGNCCFRGTRCCGIARQWCCAQQDECGASYMTCSRRTTQPPRYTTPKPPARYSTPKPPARYSTPKPPARYSTPKPPARYSTPKPPARSSTPKPSTLDYCPNNYGKKICCDVFKIVCVAGSDCCSNGNCCFRGTRCCGNGQWCCANSQKCGTKYKTCGAKGIYPVVGLILAAVVSLLFNGKTHFFL